VVSFIFTCDEYCRMLGLEEDEVAQVDLLLGGLISKFTISRSHFGPVISLPVSITISPSARHMNSSQTFSSSKTTDAVYSIDQLASPSHITGINQLPNILICRSQELSKVSSLTELQI
jgi:hypothetical protein